MNEDDLFKDNRKQMICTSCGHKQRVDNVTQSSKCNNCEDADFIIF